MSLSEWEANGWLKAHKTSREEVQNILNIIERDIKDSEISQLSNDWKFAIAYNAALQCATIALYSKGYKPVRGQNEHYRVIQSLSLTMGDRFSATRDYLNSCRAKRNISDYDRVGTISNEEVKELTETIRELLTEVKVWLKNNYLDLYS